MSTRFFPTVSKAVSDLRRASPCGALQFTRHRITVRLLFLALFFFVTFYLPSDIQAQGNKKPTNSTAGTVQGDRTKRKGKKGDSTQTPIRTPSIQTPSINQLLMPDVSKCTDLKAAEKRLNDLGMLVNVHSPREYGGGCPEGKVYNQDPPFQRRIKPGQTAELYVSLGLLMPNFVGQPYVAAQSWLSERSHTKLEHDSEKIEKDNVYEQVPKAGTDLLSFKGTVTITVSTGPSPNVDPKPLDPPTNNSAYTPVPMPDVLENSYDDASARIQRLTKAAIIRHDDENRATAGTIFQQMPAADTDLKTWKRDIVLYVSKGPRPAPGGGFDWRILLLPAALLLPGAVITTKVLRRRKWKRLIDVDASIDQPASVRMTPLNKSSESLGMNVQILPGGVQFAGPIKVTRKRGDE